MNIDYEKLIMIAMSAGSVITLREDSVKIEPMPELLQKEEPKSFVVKKVLDPKKHGAKKALDMGKVKALRDAGWPLSEIAAEMGVSPQTIANRLKGEE